MRQKEVGGVMNELNYASLEASKRLVEAGILERCIQVGDRVQHITGDKGFVIYFESTVTVITDNGKSFRCDPRTLTILYSMAEVWRELPMGTILVKEPHCISCVHYFNTPESKRLSTNPTDALIDLLIWVKKEVWRR